jgi:hypothetical protein
MRLIHRRASSVLIMEKDPFRSEEDDPMETRALKSSLWEIDSIMR